MLRRCRKRLFDNSSKILTTPNPELSEPPDLAEAADKNLEDVKLLFDEDVRVYLPGNQMDGY